MSKGGAHSEALERGPSCASPVLMLPQTSEPWLVVILCPRLPGAASL